MIEAEGESDSSSGLDDRGGGCRRGYHKLDVPSQIFNDLKCASSQARSGGEEDEIENAIS